MWEDWERLVKQVAKTSQQVVRAFEDLRGPDPYVRIQEQARSVKVTIIPSEDQKVRRWAVRVWDDRLFIRGHYTADITVRDENGTLRQERRNDEFVKAVRLPVPVEAEPSMSRRDGETLTVLFAKRKDSHSDGWIEL